MDEVRNPAVAGMFYPDDTINLKRIINTFLSNVPEEVEGFFKKNSIDNIFGIIVPHAGYVYSGQVAAYAYELLRQKSYDTVILIGPSHYTYFEGFALSYYKSYKTPLGEIETDTDFIEKVASVGAGVFDFVNTAHIKEHSLEVQLPFLQTALENKFKIVPILMGEQSLKSAQEGAAVLAQILKDYDRHYLVVISSDLSHYHDSKAAGEMDKNFISLVEKMDSKKMIESVNEQRVEACGAGPIATLLELARALQWNNVKTLKYQNSGDVSGDYARVVGYMTAVVW